MFPVPLQTQLATDERVVSESYCRNISRYLCPYSSKCINVSAVCDGDIHCPGGREEMNCSEYIVLCDGDIHCPGGREEMNCGEYIVLCDGAIHCPGGERTWTVVSI